MTTTVENRPNLANVDDVGFVHLVGVDRGDHGHRGYCPCGGRGWHGPVRFDVEQALFDCADHVARQLLRRLRRRKAFAGMPWGPGLWPWLLDHRHLVDGELVAIVDLVAEGLAEWAVPARRRHAKKGA